MKTKLLQWSFLTLLSFLLLGCGSSGSNSTDSGIASENLKTDKNNTVYTMFSMNVHDFIFTDKSTETLNRVLDIHETYQIPIDIYLTDPVLKKYEVESPELVNRLKTSSVVSICYHVRPPSPYYGDFTDVVGLDGLSDDNLTDTLTKYESYEIDLSTGELTDKAGGYKYIKSLFGKAPVIAAINENDHIATSLSHVYARMGATFSVRHGKDSSLGTVSDNLYLRPEDAEIPLYTYPATGDNPSQKLNEAYVNLSTKDGEQFINIKYHENNFYTVGTPFWSIYYKTPQKKIPLDPPWDITKPERVQLFKTQEEQDKHWEIYTQAVKYIADHKESFNPKKADDIVTIGKTPTLEKNDKVLYIISMMHAEDNVHFESDEVTYKNVADSIKELRIVFDKHNAKLDIGPDWTFVQGVLNWEPTFLTEHLSSGHGIHTHAHETVPRYNLKGVNDLLLQAGITNTIANGGWFSQEIKDDESWTGYIADIKNNSGEQLFKTVVAYKNPSTQISDTTGFIFRPSRSSDWKVEDPNGKLIYIGSNSLDFSKGVAIDFDTYRSWIDDRLNNLQAGKINTLYWHDSMHNYINPFNDPESKTVGERAYRVF